MAFLTDRTLATGVTLQDLIHIVITGDTSQGNFAGSSYKATIQQVSDAILSGQTQLYEVGTGTDSTQRIGVSAEASGDYSLVAGGTGNTSSGNYSFVGGGKCNTSSGTYSTISGGWDNTSSGYYTTISGGYTNTAIGFYSIIGGGLQNTSNGQHSTVGGGKLNKSICCNSTVSGGYCNTSNCTSATVSGGVCNTSSGIYSFVGGGQSNTASGIHSVVGGGQENKATSFCNFVGGGSQNTALGFRTTIAGGRQNTTSSTYSIIGGGWCNKAICTESTIGGGRCNSAFGNGSSILGGWNNTTNCNYGTILGGSGNTVNHELSGAFGKDVVSVSACTFHVNYLALQNTPETDVQTTTQYLTRDSATGVVKTKIIPGPTVYGLFAQTGDSTTVSATITPTTLIGPGIGTLSVPANGFTIGDSFRVKMAGIISNPSNNDISIRVKANSTVLVQNSTPFNLTSHSNDVFDLEIDFTIRNTGSAGVASVMALGKFYTVLKNGSNVQGTSFENLENTLFDTTIPNTLDIEVIWGQVDVGDSIYSRTFVLNKIY